MPACARSWPHAVTDERQLRDPVRLSAYSSGGCVYGLCQISRYRQKSSRRTLAPGSRTAATSATSRVVSGGSKELASVCTAHLEPEVQRRIGVAVGQRAMRETFVIRQDGVEECAERDAPEIWSATYREGAFEGLFVDPHGQLTVDSWSARWAPRLIAPLEDPADVIGKLAGTIGELPVAGLPPGGDSRDDLIATLGAGSRFLPEASQSAWNDLVCRLDLALR